MAKAVNLQADLWSQPPAQRHSPTSRAAAESIKPSVSKLRQRVLDCIAQHQPVTDDGISAITGISANTARPRRVELVQAGLIRAGGISKRTRSGRKATAWVISAPQDS